MTEAAWESAPGSRAPQSGRPRHGRRPTTKKRGRRRVVSVVLLTVMGILGVLLICCAWVGWDAWQARSVLTEAQSEISELQNAVTAQDGDKATALVSNLQANATKAANLTSGPQWSLVGTIPWVGDNTRAMAKMAASVDHLSQDALPKLMDAYTMASPANLAPKGGAINLTPLIDAKDDVVHADKAVQTALADVQKMPKTNLVGPLKDAADTLETKLASVRQTTATAARAVELLPPMLGSGGPRDYIVLVQNNAEPRALGGIPGTILKLHVDNGKISLAGSEQGGALGSTETPVLPLSEAENALFADKLGRYMVDVTFTPDFPRAAQLAQAMWKVKTGQDVSGVLSVDPVALANILSALGPVSAQLPDGTTKQLDGASTAQFLLNGVYLDYPDPQVQDAIFASFAGAVFTQALTGNLDSGKVLDALNTSAREGRLMAWSANEKEQALIAPTMVSGALQPEGSASPVVGIYFNATSASKIGYYLDRTITVDKVQCTANGSRAFDLTIALKSTVDPATVSTLPAYVTSTADRSGTIHTNMLVYAPVGGAIVSFADYDGTPGFFAQEHDGLDVGAQTVHLPPGETKEYKVTLVTGKAQDGPIRVRTTPGARPDTLNLSPTQCQ